MPITVTPALSTKAGYIEDVRDQIATLIRFVIMNPGWTSSIWESDMISFRNMSSRYEGDRETFASRLGDRVKSTIDRMFSDYSASCDFTTSNYNTEQDDGRYSISFNIFINKRGDATSEPALISGNITVDPKTNDIILKYDKTADNTFIGEENRYAQS